MVKVHFLPYGATVTACGRPFTPTMRATAFWSMTTQRCARCEFKVAPVTVAPRAPISYWKARDMMRRAASGEHVPEVINVLRALREGRA